MTTFEAQLLYGLSVFGTVIAGVGIGIGAVALLGFLFDSADRGGGMHVRAMAACLIAILLFGLLLVVTAPAINALAPRAGAGG